MADAAMYDAAGAAEKTTRVNKQMLGNYVQRMVRVVGRVVSAGEGQMTMEASDHGEVVVRAPGVNFDSSLKIVEILGKVNDDLSLEASLIANLGEFDLDVYERAIQASFKFPDLFA